MAKLKYDKEYYNVSSYYSSHPLNRKQMETEYDRLRKQANRSLSRIAVSEFADDQFYKNYYNAFTEPAKNLTDRQLAFLLQDVAYYVSSARSTYTGAREAQRKAVRSLKAHGYGFVTYKNYRQFAEFMGQVKDAYGDRLYDSKRVVEFFEENKSSEVTTEQLFKDFNEYIATTTI